MSGLLALVLAAAPLKLAAPGFTCSGMPPEVCSAYLDRFAALLKSDRLLVTSASDVATLLGLERQKQLLGCSGQGDCLAELAGALGVDGLLTGNIVKTESSFLATLKVVHARDGSTWVEATTRVKSEDALNSFLEDSARSFGARLAPAPRGPLPKWLPTLCSALVVVAGAGVFGWAKTDANRLADVQGVALSIDEVHTTAARGRITEPLGATLLGVGLAALVASLIFWVVAP